MTDVQFARDVQDTVFAAYAALPWVLAVAFVVVLIDRWLDG